MPISLSTLEVTQKRVNFYINNKSILITLTKELFSWDFSVIRKEKELTVAELTEICNILYKEGVIDSDDCIRVSFGKNDSVLIHSTSIEDDIKKGVKVKL